MSMLFKIGSQYGHIIEDTPDGPVYQDDKCPVDGDNPRPCWGCGAAISPGSHDPCLVNLPGTDQACCGHGQDRPDGKPTGYAALSDGRCLRFSGCLRGQGVRQAVEAALKGESLPEGFALDNNRLWWEELTEAQKSYVWQHLPDGLAGLIREQAGGQPSEQFLKGEAPWWDGLNEEQKSYVLGRLCFMQAQLVQEALKAIPA